ncbi:hypothetical protein QJS10_CPA10g01461 [Acorus calamus]|uniref:Uncharacterized protein n=1 Tax=Acorus calamus TaxID=4465 RepID=A0AAV9E246_ACOCL|nr:hypothetical protein QJS10_CPA10g01461 [Acorus calamus]
MKMGSLQILILKDEHHKLQAKKITLQEKLNSLMSYKCTCIDKDELRKENAILRERIHRIHQAFNQAFLISQLVQSYTCIGTSDSRLLGAVNGPFPSVNVMESVLLSYSTMVPIIPQGYASQSGCASERCGGGSKYATVLFEN